MGRRESVRVGGGGKGLGRWGEGGRRREGGGI